MKIKEFLKQNKNKTDYQYHIACYVKIPNARNSYRIRKDYIEKEKLIDILNCNILKIENEKTEYITMNFKGNTKNGTLTTQTAIINEIDYFKINKKLKNSIDKLNKFYNPKKKRILL